MTATNLPLPTLQSALVPFSALEFAFGPSSLGILIISDLPPRYTILRKRLLTYASYLAHLPTHELTALTNPAAHYEIGWSHGVEALKDGRYDTMKGSFYVDCQAFYLDNPIIPEPGQNVTRGAGANLWPKEQLIPGFRATFEELCTMLINIGALVARAIDSHAVQKIEGYTAGYLERIVRTSHTPKARLLHYFPPDDASAGASPAPSVTDSEDDSWCATHLDDGCLTALTSALFIDESYPLPPLTSSFTIPEIPVLDKSPDPAAGLYIKSRTQTTTKVNIPPDCIAFQTGEALEKITDGKFKAVPHFVRGPSASVSELGNGKGGSRMKVTRNTLAVFMQPDLGEVIDRRTGETYGEFVDKIVERHS